MEVKIVIDGKVMSTFNTVLETNDSKVIFRQDMDMRKHVEEIQIAYIIEAMRLAEGNVTKANSILRLGHNALTGQLKKFGLEHLGKSKSQKLYRKEGDHWVKFTLPSDVRKKK